jgi:hypothetical protein
VVYQWNYFKNNTAAGGSNFLHCLFNPQLDIYTYVKHYRETSTPVLTFPPALHRYHRGGFPFLTAFRDGHRIHRGVITPYEETFLSLRAKFWPGRDARVTPTSTMQMATRFVWVNESHLGVAVVPDGDSVQYSRISKWAAKGTTKGFTIKYERDLLDTDLRKNLWFEGKAERFKFTVFQNRTMPLRVSPSTIQLGDYEFPTREVSLKACCPNPHNREKYVLFVLTEKNGRKLPRARHVDFAVFGEGLSGTREPIFHGVFRKDADNRWEFSDSLAFGDTDLSRYRRKAARSAPGDRQEGPTGICEKGICPGPSRPSGNHEIHEHKAQIAPWVTTPNGEIRTLGTSACRFPSMTVDADGVCWVAWEENGDILLASVNRPESQVALAVEHDTSDSFNPIIVSHGIALWTFYLNNREGFYWLYGRYFDGSRLSDPILVSERAPVDVITPAAVSDHQDTIVVAWSEWEVNQKFLKYRSAANRAFGKIQDVAIKRVLGGYANAWYPSLAMDGNGRAWGAWNQHYPATLGVCAGNLVKRATSVTRLTGHISTNENGGYPSIVLDGQGRKWVFWESFSWDIVTEGKPQRILASCYDDERKQWTLPYTLTHEKQTVLNQTPRAAVDENGVLWAVWSGRKDDLAKPWAIYLSRFSEKRWTVAQHISEDGVNSQAPNICIGKAGSLWVSWHAGVGEDMRVKVLNYTSKT